MRQVARFRMSQSWCSIASTIAMADRVEALLKQKGINVVAKEVFSIRLTDGSVIAQRLRRARPQMVFFLTAIAPIPRPF